MGQQAQKTDLPSSTQHWLRSAPWWRRGLARMGLRGKLIVAFVMVLALGLGASCWVFVRGSERTLKGIMGQQAAQLSMTLALASKNPLIDKDVPALDRIGRDLLKSRNIVYVAFFDRSGAPLTIACCDPDWGESNLPGLIRQGTHTVMQVQSGQTPSLGDYQQVVAPVLGHLDGAASRATTLVGYVAVGVSQTREQTQVRQVIYLSLGMALATLLLSLPLVTGLVMRILLPIRQLVHAAGRIAAGDFGAQVAVHRPDEIGSLARAFNEMAQQVQQQQEQLRQANKNLEDKVQKRTAELEASNQRLSAEIAEKEDFLRAVSHDLNAPLRNIGGMASMLLMKYSQKFDQDVIHRLERIQKNVEAETDLITELLELSRIKTRRQKVEAVDMAQLVRDVAGMFENDLRTHNIQLVVDSALPAITGEKARLRQVFQNLIDNAIKYMGSGPVKEIHIGCCAQHAMAEFYVRDTGIGIDAEDLHKVFYVFRRGKNVQAGNVSGKGVGLASVKSIIETHNGRIWVESQVGTGSRFRFTLPLATAATAQPPQVAALAAN